MIIAEMLKHTCVICGSDTWIFIPSEEIFKKSRCMHCKSSLISSLNQEFIDKMIENIQRNQI